MSGLEPFAALSLACNIFTVITFSRDVCHVAEQIRSGTGSNPGLEKNVTGLKSALGRLESTSVGHHGQDDDEKQLLDIARDCEATASAILSKVAALSKQGRTKWVGATIRTLKHRRGLEDLERQLDGTLKLMQTDLAVRIYNKHAVLEHEVGVKLHEFIKAENQVQMKKVEEEASITRAHITSEIEGMKGLTLDHNYERKRDQFINSFKFEGMNERQNEASEPHDSTFHWILHDYVPHSNTEGEPNHKPRWDSFTQWLETDSAAGPYWINGKPGSGKTTLTKYILSNPGTQTHLQYWKGDVMIISHFLWRLGSVIQHNLKGMFCSLIYKLLKGDSSAIADLFSSHGTLDRNSYKDWSRFELRKICLELIRTYPRSLCIVIDALDEIHPDDGYDELFRFLKELSLFDNVKLCISTRPEPAIQKRLPLIQKRPSAISSLRLQDLTYNDIYEYVKDQLHIDTCAFLSEEQQRKLINELIWKAEGVFLWVHLTVQSLNRGLEHTDSFEELKRRIDILPSDLETLYNGMWLKQNDDKQIYRESAALYFRVALHYATGFLTGFSGELDPLLMTLMTTPHLLEKFRLGDGDSKTSADEMINKCEETKNNVTIRCAGLLQLVLGDKSNPELQKAGGKFDALIPYADEHRVCFRFIHRTARDFLEDTVEGKRILSFSNLSGPEIWYLVVEADLALCQLLDPLKLNARQRHDWNDSFKLVYRIYKSRLGSDCSQTATSEAHRLLDLCSVICSRKKLWKSRLSDHSWRTHICSYDDLLSTATRFAMGFYILEILDRQSLSRELKSRLLYCVALDRDPDAQLLYCRLLNQNADPNYVDDDWDPISIEFPGTISITAFYKFLTDVFGIVVSNYFDQKSFQSYLQTIDEFVVQDADASLMVFLDLYLTQGSSRVTGTHLSSVWDKTDGSICTQFTAWDLIVVILDIVERVGGREQGDVDEHLSSVIERLRSKCEASHLGSGRGRVIAIEKNNICKEVADVHSGILGDKLHEALVHGLDSGYGDEIWAQARRVYKESEQEPGKVLEEIIENNGGVLTSMGKKRMIEAKQKREKATVSSDGPVSS